MDSIFNTLTTTSTLIPAERVSYLSYCADYNIPRGPVPIWGRPDCFFCQLSKHYKYLYVALYIRYTHFSFVVCLQGGTYLRAEVFQLKNKTKQKVTKSGN